MFNLTSVGASIWRNENRISSDEETVGVQLPEVDRETETGIYGKLAEVDVPLSGSLQNCGVFQPGKKVTTTCFDKGQLYYSLNYVQNYLLGLGVNIPKTLADSFGAKAFPVKAHADAVSDLNAWYSPQTKELTFGTYGDMSKGQDRWHLAADGDVSTHEFGHLILDAINPLLGRGWKGEGGAIHEGFGDALTALLFDDPEMSEDFSTAMGQSPDKKKGLRTVDNSFTIGNTTTEVHDRGQVYAGFFWSLKKALSDPSGGFKLSSRQASDVTLRLLFEHAKVYQAASPSSKDFVQAVLAGVDALGKEEELGFDKDALKAVVVAEAGKRGMMKRGEQDTDSEAFARSFEELRGKFGNNISFESVKKNQAGDGDVHEILQQRYKTARGFEADVVGGDAVVKKDERGNILSISTKGLRPIGPGEIDESVSISPARALSIAMGDAQKMKAKSSQWMMSLWGSRPKDFIKIFAGLQMDYKIADTAIESLGKRGFDTIKPGMAIIPNSNNLQYEIKVGLGIYYINAKTGEATFKKDVYVN